MCDDQGACDTADVTVTVDPVNDQQPPQPTPTPAPQPAPSGLPASDASAAWAILTGGSSGGPGGPGMAGGLLVAVLALMAAGLAWAVLRRRGTDSDRGR